MVPDLQLPRHLAHPLRNDPVLKISRVNHVLTQLAPVTLLLVLCLVFFNKKERDKAEVNTSRGGTGESCVRTWLTRELSRPGRSGGDEPGLEAIGGREP